MITKLSGDIQASALQKLAMIRTTGFQGLGVKKSVMDKLRLMSQILREPARPEGLSELLSQMFRDSRMTRVHNAGNRARTNGSLKDIIQAKKTNPEVFRERGLYPNGVDMPGGIMDLRDRTDLLNRTSGIGYYDDWRLPFYTGR